MKKEWLVRHIEKGLTTREMAISANVSQTTVRYWLKKFGLKTKHSPVGHRTWTDEDLVKATEKAITKADILRALHLKPTTGNYVTLEKHIHRLKIDISHLKGRRAGKGRVKQKSLEEVLVRGSTYNRSSLKRRLLRNNILEKKCAICGLGTEWNNLPLVLVLDHINGIRNDHRLENLRLLCPNCNSQQKTFGSRGKGSCFVK